MTQFKYLVLALATTAGAVVMVTVLCRDAARSQDATLPLLFK